MDVLVTTDPYVYRIERSFSNSLATPYRVSSAPAGRSPYTAPPDVIYKLDSILNPHFATVGVQPRLDSLPFDTLYRPGFLPSDFDDRIDKLSVWMGVERGKDGELRIQLRGSCQDTFCRSYSSYGI